MIWTERPFRCDGVSPNLSQSAPPTFLKITLAVHFQNATVGFLQPIEDPITISFAALLFAHNDRQNVSLVCPLLPFCSPFLSLSTSLYLTLSVSEHVILSFYSHPSPFPRSTPTSMSGGNERRGGGKLQDSVYFSRIIEICLDANGISCLPKCLNISQTQTCTQKFACEFKQKAFGRDDAWGVYAVLTHLPLARVCIRRGRLSSTLAHMANLDVSLSPPRRWSCGLPAHTRPSWRSCLLASRFISRPL